MKWLITSDIHLSDRPRDAYRFGLFPWLAQQQQKHEVTATFILGDLTQEKDRHPSSLVNRTIDEMTNLRPPVYLLEGNHDGNNPGNPFFRFANCIDGVHFITKPTWLSSLRVAMIPHHRKQSDFDEACAIIKPDAVGVMVHQTFEGAEAESGARLAGLSSAAIEAAKPGTIWAGDVHVPQRLGAVTYIGAPYTIRFGDDFTPRVLLVKPDGEQNLYFDCLRKWVLHIESPDELGHYNDLRPGDQVKITVTLPRESIVGWAAMRRKVLEVCHQLELDVFGVNMDVKQSKPKPGVKIGTGQTPHETIEAFCVREGLSPSIKKAGVELLKRTVDDRPKILVTR